VTSAPIHVPVPKVLAAGSFRALRRELGRHPTGAPLVLDCHELESTDALVIARLLRIVAEGRAAGHDVHLAHLDDAARRALANVDPVILEQDTAPRRHPLEVVGAHALEATATAGQIQRLAAATVAGLTRPFGAEGIKWDRTLRQMALIGVEAVPIVVFISLLVGVVLALNGATQLRQFGASIFIANLVAISTTREMGPLLTAVIVSGRTGSAIAAEIGSMVISEEVDAMHTMALNPVRFLVVPKVLALVLMMPLLTVMSNLAAISGGYAVGVLGLDLGSDAYLSQTVQSLFMSDVTTGLVKSVVFGVIIGLVGAHRGFAVRGGPEAVGRAATSAVVTSIIACIVANACFTALFYYTE